ncbi:phage head closure protein [Pseudomonas sp. W2-17]|jgi:SPP1 family predicted phage head-tail adaptor|uniref:phage head closure protein n=1 Tax=Pseudomonas sp. W2-17 TaxID=3058039 RepID=UPI0034E0B105
MRAGKLRHHVMLQRAEYSQDPVTGEVTPSWVEVGKVWAAIEPLSAREFIAAAAGQSEVAARIVIRYRPGITSTMRVLYRGKVYNIQGVLADMDSGLDYLTLPCSEGVSDG